MTSGGFVMKAVQIAEFGDASVLVTREIERPVPLGRDILVRVMASGVNPIEWKIRGGGMAKALGRDLPVTCGWACAGIVEQIGPGVTTFKVGDAIYTYPEFTRGGTHADFALMDETQAALKPASLSFAQASAVPMTAQAACTAVAAAKLCAGERVLIHGAAGAVGHWLIQMAKSVNTQVIATASGEGMDAVRDLGAKIAIDYRTERFEDVAGHVDVVFDLVGGETQARSWALLSSGGRLVSTAHPTDEARAKAIGATGTFVFTPPDGRVLADIARRIDRGVLRPLLIALELPLGDAVQAHRLGEAGKAGGKIALIPSHTH
jgi:NADPH:quinone reductase-like Zn-dependent oxidoreductase